MQLKLQPRHLGGGKGITGRPCGAALVIVGLTVLLTGLSALSAGAPLVRASVSSAGAQANAHTGALALSGDGRCLAFVSAADNLVPGDANGTADVFVRDLESAVTQLASVGSGGVQSNGTSVEVAISDTGRFVAFTSSATNLTPDGGNRKAQLFLRDRQADVTVRLSQNANGEPADASAEDPDLTGSGSFVVFTSRASNLVSGATGGKSQVYLVNTANGQLERISSAPNGAPGNGNSHEGFVSADGRFVAYYSDASNLVSGDTDGQGDLFVRDRQIGLTRMLTKGDIPFASHCTDLSPSGEYAAFTVPADGTLFVKEQVGIANVFNGSLRIVSRGIDFELNGDSGEAKINNTGQLAAFLSFATNVRENDPSLDTNRVPDVFVADLAATQAIRVARVASRTSSGAPANAASSTPSLSNDGKRIAFVSAADNLVPNDTNGRIDVFVRDRSGETLVPISYLELTSDGPTRLAARWTDTNSTETGYEVELAREDGPFTRVATTTVNGFSKQLTGLSPNTRYRCRVRAINAVDAAPYGLIAVWYTLPNAPKNAAASAVPRTTKLLVTWEAPVGGAASYVVERLSEGTWNHLEDVPGTAPLQVQDWPSPGGLRHSYRVVALSGVRQRSQPSNSANILALPGAPSLPVATAGPGRVEISWRPSLGATAYRVKRSELPEGPFTKISGDVAGSAYTDQSPPPGRALYYVVSALNTTGEGPDSQAQSVQSAPAAPTELRAVPGYEFIHLSWQPSSGAGSYMVLRSETKGGPYAVRKDFLQGTSADDSGAPATTYYYVVQARGEGAVSAFSTEVAVTTAPVAPGALTATPGSGKITLTWAAVPGATKYRLRRNSASGPPITQIGGDLTTTRYVDGGHGGGETYQYRLIAVNAGGESRESLVVTATTQAVLKSLALKPASVKGGKRVTATVTLDAPAPVGGSPVMLTSDNSTLVRLPASIRVPAGKGSFKFQFFTRKLSKKQKTTSVRITAKLDEKRVEASLRVKK